MPLPNLRRTNPSQRAVYHQSLVPPNGNYAPAVREIWFCSNANTLIQRYNANLTAQKTAITSPSTVYGMLQMGPYVYVASSISTGTITVYNLDGSVEMPATAVTSLSFSNSLVNVNGLIWATQNSGTGIVRINPYTLVGIGSGITTPTGVTGCDTYNGLVYMPSFTPNNVLIFNADGTNTGRTFTGNSLSGPRGCAVINNILWVINFTGNTISLFNLDGTSAGSITGNGLNAPRNVKLIGTEVWVAGGSGNGVWVYTTGGTFLRSVVPSSGTGGLYDIIPLIY